MGNGHNDRPCGGIGGCGDHAGHGRANVAAEHERKDPSQFHRASSSNGNHQARGDRTGLYGDRRSNSGQPCKKVVSEDQYCKKPFEPLQQGVLQVLDEADQCEEENYQPDHSHNRPRCGCVFPRQPVRSILDTRDNGLGDGLDRVVKLLSRSKIEHCRDPPCSPGQNAASESIGAGRAGCPLQREQQQHREHIWNCVHQGRRIGPAELPFDSHRAE